MPGYFPKGGGWPAIAKTTPGVIRGTVYKHLDQYVPSMNDAILSQMRTLEFKDGGKSLSLWILVSIGMIFIIDRMYIRLLRLRILGGSTQRQLCHGGLTAFTRRGISKGCERPHPGNDRDHSSSILAPRLSETV